MTNHRAGSRRRSGRAAAVLALALALSGCLGAGDDAGRDEAVLADVRYNGNTNPADFDAANVTVLARAVLGLSGTLGVLPGGARVADAVGATGVVAAVATLTGALDHEGSVFAAAVTAYPFISVMEQCDGGGEKVQTADGNRLTIDYFDCVQQGVTVNGSATRVGDDDANTTTLSGIRLTAPGFDLGFGGSFSYLDRGTLSAITLHDLVIADHRGGEMLRAEELVITGTELADGIEVTVNGRLLHSAHGAILIETADLDPLFFAAGDRYPTTGMLSLFGANAEYVVLMALTSTQVNVEADLDGDGSAEIDRIATWAEIETGIDLAGRGL